MASSRRNSYEVNPVVPNLDQAERKENNNRVAQQKIARKFCGNGIPYNVKFIGTEVISKSTPATATLKNLKSKHASIKVSLVLSVKGLTMVEESSKKSTKVLLMKIRHICHDSHDNVYFGITISTKESSTGYQLYGFKADKTTATDFVADAKELVSFVQTIMIEKKKALSDTSGVDASDVSHGISQSAADQVQPQSMRKDSEEDVEKMEADVDGMMQYILTELNVDPEKLQPGGTTSANDAADL